MMEQFNESSKEESGKGLYERIKRSIGLMLVAGTLTACDDTDQHDKKHSEEGQLDRFDRASQKVDAAIQEGKEVLAYARSRGINVPEGVPFHYQKKEGKVVSITVGGQTIPLEMLLDDKVESEVKINPVAKEFINGAPETKPSDNGSTEKKINLEEARKF